MAAHEEQVPNVVANDECAPARLSAASTSSSLYTSPSLDVPLRPSPSVLKSIPPQPRSVVDKPLPPLPVGQRPASSIYSFDAARFPTRLSLHHNTTPAELPSRAPTDGYNVPKPCSANGMQTHMQETTANLALETNASRPADAKGKSESLLLETRVYAPSHPSARPSPSRSRQRVGYIATTEHRYRQIRDPHATTQPMRMRGETGYRQRNASQSSPSFATLGRQGNVIKPPPRPLATNEQRAQASYHQRGGSNEKAKATLGINSEKLQEESEQRHRCHLFGRHHYRYRPQESRPYRHKGFKRPFSLEPIPESARYIKDDEAEYLSDNQHFSDEYHDQLAQQYRSSNVSLTSSTSPALPAQLTFRNRTSPLRRLELTHLLQKWRERLSKLHDNCMRDSISPQSTPAEHHSGSSSNMSSPAQAYKRSSLEGGLSPAQMTTKNHIHFRNLETMAMRATASARTTQELPHPRSPCPRPRRRQSFLAPIVSFLSDALSTVSGEPTQNPTTSDSHTPHRSFAATVAAMKRTKSQKRRDELKASIRHVGAAGVLEDQETVGAAARRWRRRRRRWRRRRRQHSG